MPHFEPPERHPFTQGKQTSKKGTMLIASFKIIFITWLLLHLHILAILNSYTQPPPQTLPLKASCKCINCPEDQQCGGLWHANRYPGTPPESQLRHKTIRIIVSHCKNSLHWLKKYTAGFDNIASIHVFSKCGVKVEKPPLTALVASLPNVGRNDHTFAYYITSVLPAIVSPTEDSIVVFLKDSIMDNIHQGSGGEYQKLNLTSLVRLASSENGFGCGLGVVHPDTSAYHDTATLSQFNMGLYPKGDYDYNEVKAGKEDATVRFLSTYENLGSFYQSLPAQQSKSDVTPVCYGGIFSASIANIYKQDMSVWKSLQKKLERGDNIQEGHYAERLWARLLSTPLKPHQVKALKNYATGVMERADSTYGPLVRQTSLKGIRRSYFNRLGKHQHARSAQNAVVHIGPYKTGSTTIQYLTQKFSGQLLADGYSMPYSHTFANGTSVSNPLPNQVQVATCFFDGVSEYTNEEGVALPCRADLLEAGQDIGQRGRSILLSAETFSALADTGILALRDCLQMWDNVTIVAFYRRYYKWILSVHKEVSKTKYMADPFAKIQANVTDFLGKTILGDFSDVNLMLDLLRKYTLSSVDRYKRRFANVVVANMDELEMTIEEYFFCHAIPNATRTCDAVRGDLETNGRQTYNRDSQDEVYRELAYQAHRKGVFSIDSEKHYHDTFHAMQYYQEKVLNRTASDFPRTLCLPKSILDAIWEFSVQAEKQFGSGKDSIDEMKKEFTIMTKSELCDVDYDAILDSESWKEFFGKHAANLISSVVNDPVMCEQGYLNMHPDVLRAVQSGKMPSGLVQWKMHGKKEGRRPYCSQWYDV